MLFILAFYFSPKLRSMNPKESETTEQVTQPGVEVTSDANVEQTPTEQTEDTTAEVPTGDDEPAKVEESEKND